ncbi:MAG: hypothetical protein RL368_1434 [Pseudomonadota bacterium]|jgi:hypothetical protein
MAINKMRKIFIKHSVWAQVVLIISTLGILSIQLFHFLFPETLINGYLAGITVFLIIITMPFVAVRNTLLLLERTCSYRQITNS